MKLRDFKTITYTDLQTKSLKYLPDFAKTYLMSGTGSNSAVQENLNQFGKYHLIPHINGSGTPTHVETSFLANKYSVPFGIAPVGMAGMVWPKAELKLCDTARLNNFPFTLSTVGCETPESVFSEESRCNWFQLYIPKEQFVLQDILSRLIRLKVETLIITVDIPTPSRRESIKNSGISIPFKFKPALLFQAIAKPRWLFHTVCHGIPTLKTIVPYAERNSLKFISNYAGNRLGGVFDWPMIEELKKVWSGKIILKGILNSADVQKAIDMGIDSVYISNHGGRQLDGVISPLEALKQIRSEVGWDYPLIVDGGFRTGTDIFKALYLGADFVMLGRPFIMSTALKKAQGPDLLYKFLEDDLKNVMTQMGIRSISELFEKRRLKDQLHIS